MRYHELALQSWLNKIFVLRWGVPVPVVFTSPMDAFSTFSRLWSEANNPFQYLLEAKDSDGNPLYQPHPAPVRYPLISVHRKGWKLRAHQNFSIHRMRWINWPTVSDAGADFYGTHHQGTELTRCNLGEVTTSRFPMAFDFRYQIDHFCNRPDTQAFFISQLFREFWRTGGVQPQTWMVVKYPGMGDKLVRLYIDGDVESLTEEEPQDGKNVEYRASFTLVMEGYDLDLDYRIYPALWRLILREGSAPPGALDAAFEFVGTVDLREQAANPTISYRDTVSVMPPAGTCALELRNERLEQQQIHEIRLQSLVITPTPPGYPPASGVIAFGVGTLVGGTNAVQDAGTYTNVSTAAWAFHVGSMDLFIYTEQASGSYAFSGGTHFPVTVASGTQTDSQAHTCLFTSGSYTSAVVAVDYGTEPVISAWAMGTGTYFDTVVDGGSYYDNGSLSMTLSGGTYSALIVEAGTRTDSGAMTAAFLNGTYV